MSDVTDSVSGPDFRLVHGQRVHVTTYADATERVISWAQQRESRYVCASNVHMVMHGHDVPAFRQVVNGADLVTPDGMPLVWALRALGVKDATRVYGPDLTLHVCRAAAEARLPIGLYGASPESLGHFSSFLRERFPGIQIACAISPPFRPLSKEEDEAYARQMTEAGVRLLFVGLGCPKQEQWMAEHKGRLDFPMLGVGAAFDFHSGRIRQAPSWMQRCGLEWLFRLVSEPRRLAGRYFRHNPRFALFLLKTFFLHRVFSRGNRMASPDVT